MLTNLYRGWGMIRFFYFSLLFSAAAFATDKIEVHRVKGEPLRVNFPDGRIAELAVDRRPAFYSSIGVEVTENTCTEKIHTVCKYYVSLKFATLNLRWLKHPDAAKVGQTLMGKTKAASAIGEFPFIEQSFLVQSDRPRFPILVGELPHEALECPDYSWLPGSGVAVPPSINVARWDVELMVANPETGLNESRTLGMNLNVLLKADPKGRLEVANVKYYTGFALAGFIGDVWALSMKRADSHEYCLVSLKPNLSLATTNFINFLSTPPQFAPYPFGADEYSGPAMTALIGSFLKAPEEYDIK